jgi:peptide/nickel transport system permease protein
VSLFVALGSVLLGLVVGVPLGLVAATSPKFVDGPLMRVMDIFMAFPLMLLAIVVVAIVGTGTLALMLAIGVGYIPVLALVPAPDHGAHRAQQHGPGDRPGHHPDRGVDHP